MVIEVSDRLLLIDCGLMFPDVDMHGIDLVLPDFTYLRDNANRIDGCVLTHGHEDHVGALSYLLR
jgi:ribonuclease J